MVKVEEYLCVLNQIISACYIISKVGLIASIFSKVCSNLWAKLSMYVFHK